MKKLPFAILGISLLLQACAGGPEYNGKSEIFGKVTVISDRGEDITKYCGTNINRRGLLMQKAVPGINTVGQITCMAGQNIYMLHAADLTVNVPQDGVAVYFGDITVKLIDPSNYAVERAGDASAQLYSGNLPVQRGNLEVGTGPKTYTKSWMGSTH